MYYTSKEVYEFISKQTNDPILEWKTCAVSGAEFPIYKSDMEFYDKISPTFAGKKYQIPTPTLCPEERQRRRLLFRNERKLYKRKCDASGKDIISIYSPDKPYKVYDQKFWRSDEWDPMDYGSDFDFEKSFMQQFNSLLKDIPHISVVTISNENSIFTSGTGYCKDCYLICASEYAENCLYGRLYQTCKDCMDSENLFECEGLYQGINCKQSSKCSYLYQSKGCFDCHFSECLQGCSYCYLSSGLVNKSYCIKNKQVSKDEYERFISKKGQYNWVAEMKKEFLSVRKKMILQYTEMINCELSYGNELFDSKNIKLGYAINGSQNCFYSSVVEKAKFCVDCDNIYIGPELCYNILGVLNVYNCISTYYAFNSNNIFYSYNVHDSSNLFGCAGLRNKSYCIFNKQYTKDEYEKLVPRIIEHMQKNGEWGHFLDENLTLFGYNETVAEEYFPLTREDALARGYTRQDNSYDPIIPEGADTIQGDQIPTDISTVTDDILKKIFICEVSGRPFRIIKQELEFYRKHDLPLPRKHPDVRHEERMKLRPPRELHLRNCDKCGVEVVSVYPKDFEGKVYCEACYNREIYG